jgi:uncharacterized protein
MGSKAGCCGSGVVSSGVGCTDMSAGANYSAEVDAGTTEAICCSSESAIVATVQKMPCCSPLATEAVATTCCGVSEESGCCGPAPRTDWLLMVCGVFVAGSYLTHLLIGDVGPAWLATLLHTSFEMVNAMWWGVISAAFFVGLLGRVPRELVMSVLGRGGSKRGIFRATLAGLMLDLCNHGILMIAMKLYERGASLGQVMAFLIASPWNSLTLTLIMIGLIGWQWTAVFIAGSLLIAWVSGWTFDRLTDRKILPANPNQLDFTEVAFWPALKNTWKTNDWTLPALAQMFWLGLKESRSVLRWVLLGVVMVALVRAFVPADSFSVWFGASISGLLLTLLATTLIEVCSEGSSPLAADLVTRAAAPGNAFTFLMAGAATDYTEVMALKETTGSWKISLFLPLVTVPQVLLLGWIMNNWNGL